MDGHGVKGTGELYIMSVGLGAIFMASEASAERLYQYSAQVSSGKSGFRQTVFGIGVGQILA